MGTDALKIYNTLGIKEEEIVEAIILKIY